jgi:L-ascorbate metabolism protein UlaG (beta-lactamase superfamily)
LVTHEHFDHNQVKKMPHAKGCDIFRAADLHPSKKSYLTIESHGVRVTAVQACNKNHPVDKCVGMVLELDGVKFYASGDTSTTDDMRSGKLAGFAIDYAVYPGDGFYNMGIEEASECAKLVGARHSIPVHLVPVDDPNDASKLFSREKAEAFTGLQHELQSLVGLNPVRVLRIITLFCNTSEAAEGIQSLYHFIHKISSI